MVATPTAITVATRMPANMTPSESGISTCHRICAVRHSHSSSGFPNGRFDAGDSRERIPDYWKQGIEKQGNDSGSCPDTTNVRYRYEKTKERKTRYGLNNVCESENGLSHPRSSRHQNSDRYADTQ